MKKKNKKVVRYRKPLHINIGVIVFGIILIYLVFNLFFYFTKKHISVYEVNQGTIATNHTYRGLILRSEEIVGSAGEGEVTYFLKDASKAGTKTPVYSLDSTGSVLEKMDDEKKDGDLFTKDNYLELENTVQSYTGSYDSQNFYSVYAFKDEMEANMMEIRNVNALNAIKEKTDTSSLQMQNAIKPGVVVYYTDGYENVKTDTLTEASFDENQYKKMNLKDQTTVGKNVPVYKLITDENWNVIFKISKDLAEKLKDDNTVEVLFKDDGNTIWAYYDILTIDKEPYLNLKLRTSMIRFANQRFIDIELLLDDAKGLKIPNSAITTKKFFTVPKEYFVKGKGSNKEGLIVTGKDKNTTYITPEIFYEKDGMYYIDDENVTSGTVIQKSDSNETYTIRQTAKLKGVYNINKGYAVFKQIDILYQNEEYAILKQGTDYGVALYDHIALKGNTVKENDLIH